MASQYLVTGGAGFIGSHLVRALLQQGERVRVLDNFATGSRDNLTDIIGDIELIEGDLRSPDACETAVKDVSFVLHQAALPSVPRSVEDPQTSHDVNVTGTVNLLVAARAAGVRRVVYASSSSVYGPEPKLPREESDRPNPISPYAVSKLAAEQYMMAFFHSMDLETVSLRYFNVFGPQQGWDSPYAAVIPLFIRALSQGRQPQIFGDGEQSRDFTYIDNVVDANLKALTSPAAPGRVYNVGAGRKTTVNDLADLVGQALGVAAHPRHEPPRVGDVRDSLADISRAVADLGYTPAVDLERGVERTVAWALNGHL